MAYVVSTTPNAERDLTDIYDYIRADESNASLSWYLGLKEAILTLQEQPNRCPIVPEAKKLKRELRHLLYGRKPHIYRIIFQVNKENQTVFILHIRHGARRRSSAADLVRSSST